MASRGDSLGGRPVFTPGLVDCIRDALAAQDRLRPASAGRRSDRDLWREARRSYAAARDAIAKSASIPRKEAERRFMYIQRAMRLLTDDPAYPGDGGDDSTNQGDGDLLAELVRVVIMADLADDRYRLLAAIDRTVESQRNWAKRQVAIELFATSRTRRNLERTFVADWTTHTPHEVVERQPANVHQEWVKPIWTLPVLRRNLRRISRDLELRGYQITERKQRVSHSAGGGGRFPWVITASLSAARTRDDAA